MRPPTEIPDTSLLTLALGQKFRLFLPHTCCRVAVRSLLHEVACLFEKLVADASLGHRTSVKAIHIDVELHLSHDTG